MRLGTTAVLGALALTMTANAATLDGRRVLLIDSYHEGYGWSDGMTGAIRSVINPSGAELRVHRMDTKRNGSEAFKEQAGSAARALIEEWRPDVVIATDDNASRYVVMPFFRDAEVPFVFAGVNWDETVYGYPYRNATGMVEVSAAGELVELLLSMSAGQRIGFLGSDTTTVKKEAENQQRVFGLTYDIELASSMAEFREKFLALQERTDVIILENFAGINDWNEDEAVAFLEANTARPTGSFYDFMERYVAISFQKLAAEQGEWAANAALRILDGASPADIPIARNEQGRLVVNARIATAAGLDVPAELVEAADLVIE